MRPKKFQGKEGQEGQERKRRREGQGFFRAIGLEKETKSPKSLPCRFFELRLGELEPTKLTIACQLTMMWMALIPVPQRNWCWKSG